MCAMNRLVAGHPFEQISQIDPDQINTMFCSQPTLGNDIVSNAKEGQEKDTYNYNPPVISYRLAEATADIEWLQKCYGKESIKTDRTLTQHYNFLMTDVNAI